MTTAGGEAIKREKRSKEGWRICTVCAPKYLSGLERAGNAVPAAAQRPEQSPGPGCQGAARHVRVGTTGSYRKTGFPVDTRRGLAGAHPCSIRPLLPLGGAGPHCEAVSPLNSHGSSRRRRFGERGGRRPSRRRTTLLL